MEENKKELDLSGVKLVQDKRKQEKELDLILALNAHKENISFEITDDNSIAHEINDTNYQRKIIDYSENIAKKSIQDDSFSKVQVCHGEHYTKKDKQKENLKIFYKVALIIAGIYVGGKMVSISTIVNEYNTSLKAKIKNEYQLSDEELKEVKMPGVITSLNQYEAEYKKLDKSDYNTNGTRKGNDENKRSFTDNIDIFSIDDMQIDAIDNATTKNLRDMYIKGTSK